MKVLRRLALQHVVGAKKSSWRSRVVPIFCTDAAINPKRGSETEESEKVPFFLVKKIREAILDGVHKPGAHLVEVELAEKF